MSIFTVYGWLAIGLGASLAAMILPFQRGAGGVAMNMISGVGGALLAPLLTYRVIPAREPDTPLRLAFAAFGALAALGLVHFGYSLFARRHSAEHEGSLPQSLGKR
jgi:hypothetical protein